MLTYCSYFVNTFLGFRRQISPTYFKNKQMATYNTNVYAI